ncbi:MAG TPA: hypothetical protein PK708_14600 [Candidatus Competibacter sp.]|nr:hypothetical protein [Candidatus Competibacter sp.]
MWTRKPKGEVAVKESVRWVEGYEIVADQSKSYLFQFEPVQM